MTQGSNRLISVNYKALAFEVRAECLPGQFVRTLPRKCRQYQRVLTNAIVLCIDSFIDTSLLTQTAQLSRHHS
ncbi:hypothetical protein AFLA_013941 [Aspergillus flavus NRRL3357]|nr:hypothetical protein AFLA_013941 [Aspergillus flavus NRRL3357]